MSWNTQFLMCFLFSVLCSFYCAEPLRVRLDEERNSRTEQQRKGSRVGVNQSEWFRFSSALSMAKQFFRSIAELNGMWLRNLTLWFKRGFKTFMPDIETIFHRAGKTRINVNLFVFSMHVCCVFTYIRTKHVLRIMNCRVSQIICQDTCV